jgi:enolase
MKMDQYEITALHARNILNSHAEFTTEFVLDFGHGTRGIGSSPKGETISIYEDRHGPADPKAILEAFREAAVFGRPLGQEQFDRYLGENLERFGRNNCFALSLAFHRGTAGTDGADSSRTGSLPRLCLNILNGGWHAYTNPVLCDFSEILLVPAQNRLMDTLHEHHQIQTRVREELLRRDKAVINGNPVSVFPARDNRAPLEFLREILEALGLAHQYRLMIDASASDLRVPQGYRFSLTDDSVRTADELGAYWKTLVEEYDIQFLEDPFHETDFGAWQALTARRPPGCEIIGDNLYSSDAGRIRQGAQAGYSNGVVIKPNQAGTVTATAAAVDAARAHGQTMIASHRSISTESTYICTVTCTYHLPYIKIGPLLTDYSSVVRVNEILRLAGGDYV